MKPEFSRQILEENTQISNFIQIRPSGSQAVPCGRTYGQTDGQTDRWADMTKLIVTFRSYANAPKMYIIHAEIYTSALFLFRDDAVGIATCYGLKGPGIESPVYVEQPNETVLLSECFKRSVVEGE